MSGVVIEDAYGHRNVSTAVALTAGAVSTTVAGTIAPTTAAGASPTVTFATGQTANDVRGSFTLSPVTGGGAQAAGVTANINFANPYGVAPACIQVTVTNNAGPAAIAAAPGNITANGFGVNTAILTTANVYTVNYVVTP
jgi:hypothetical protein